jgi:hypothetical protein
MGYQMHYVTHVDTGLGEFDHHQPERGHLQICAASLVFDHICRVHPDRSTDAPLKQLVEHVIDVDHFGEIYWPESRLPRSAFVLSSLLQGFEQTEPHDDDSQLNFGFRALDCAYATLVAEHRARLEMNTAIREQYAFGELLAVETSNDFVIKYAQKQGVMAVIKRDPDRGNVRIKVRPDCSLDLAPLYQHIRRIDQVGTWYYHPSGKMLLNGSKKHTSQKPTPLTLQQVLEAFRQVFRV